MLITTILLAAAIVVYALYQKRDVKFNVKAWGADVLFEAKDRGESARGLDAKRTDVQGD